MQLCKLVNAVCRGKGLRRNTAEKRQGHWPCVNHCLSVQLSDWALCSITAASPTFLLTSFFMAFLFKVTLYPIWVRVLQWAWVQWVPAASECGYNVSNWSQTRGMWAPRGPLVLATGVSGALGARSWSATALGGTSVWTLRPVFRLPVTGVTSRNTQKASNWSQARAVGVPWACSWHKLGLGASNWSRWGSQQLGLLASKHQDALLSKEKGSETENVAQDPGRGISEKDRADRWGIHQRPESRGCVLSLVNFNLY